MKDLNQLLSDHAYLERKAATNALDLLNRWPYQANREFWINTLAGIARDETQHLATVIKIMSERDYLLARTHHSFYAQALRKLVRQGQGPQELLDRVLTSALIEARSSERFHLLGKHCPDETLARFYRSLWSAEIGHYSVFLKLAKQIVPEEEALARWDLLLDAEAKIIKDQEPGSGIHSGPGHHSA